MFKRPTPILRLKLPIPQRQYQYLGRERTMTMTEHEMERVISAILSDQAHEDPSACIVAVNALMDTVEGRRFLSKQEGSRALVLIELFDWVAVFYIYQASMRGLRNVACQALKSYGIPLDKGRVLWTLRQLCGRC